MQRSRSSPCYGSESTACCHQGTRLRRDPPPHISCPHRGFSPSCTGPAEALHVQGTPHCHAWRPLQRAKVTKFAAQPWHALATPSGDPTALQVQRKGSKRNKQRLHCRQPLLKLTFARVCAGWPSVECLGEASLQRWRPPTAAVEAIALCARSSTSSAATATPR